MFALVSRARTRIPCLFSYTVFVLVYRVCTRIPCSYLSEAINDAHGRADASTEHVTQQEVNTATLHLAALAHANGTERG